jgi:hypothetical protein
MMTNPLFTNFSTALNWNAFLFLSNKLFSVILTFYLFNNLCSADFSLWTNTNALVFLALLWLDFGLRKSIPRFAPLFCSSAQTLSSFTATTLLMQLIILFLATPLVTFFSSRLLNTLLPLSSPLSTITALLFITEGLVALCRLHYHAHFWNKPFNLLSSIAFTLELTLNLLLIRHMPSTYLVPALFITKIITGLIIVIASLLIIKGLYRTKQYPNTPLPATSWHDFTKHSLLMWCNNILKSLSERNFLLPLMTYLLGPVAANTFKVAQDGGLLFERAILKTIGSADTALLAHVHAQEQKYQINDAFQKIITKIAGLCLPLFGLFLFIWLEGNNYYSYKGENVFQIFIIITGTYFLEVLLSPYERVLEVKKHYTLLAYAYLPYIALLPLIFITMPWIGLVNVTIALQTVRLVSLLIMYVYAQQVYQLRLPVKFIGKRIIISIGCALFASLVISKVINAGVVMKAFLRQQE